MATNPYFTQLHTQRLSFIGSPQQRDGIGANRLVDQRFLNMYPELIRSPISDGKKYYLKKRPGLFASYQLPVSATATRALFYWANNNTTYTAADGTLYANTTPIITGMANSPAPVGICEYRDDNEDVLFVCDGTSGWVVTLTNTITKITDANFPSPHIPSPVFLDGYIFLIKQGGQTIHNSTLLNPLTWPSDGFIDAEMFPDNLVGLARVQNYIAAVGSFSIEWFYDNANATGSPLQRNAPAVTQLGCPAPATINQTEKELILVGQTANGGRTIWVIDGFQPSEIANEPIREALDKEGNSIGGASAFTIQVSGHKFFVLNLTSAQRTFVFDFEEKMWHEWNSGGANTGIFQMRWATDSAFGVPTMIGYSGNQVYTFDPTVYTDNGVNIFCQATTVKVDFDSMMRKRIFRLTLVGDIPDTPNLLPNQSIPMTVEWSDNDYNTWTTGDSLNVAAQLPTIWQLGITRRRAFRFTFTQPYPLRVESFELDYTAEVRR